MRAFMARFGVFGAALVGALALAGGAGATAGPPGASDPVIAQVECGHPGQPACPLQAWMRTNVASPLAANDTAALAVGLTRAAALAPDPSWSSWATFANAGADAARNGNVASARAACKGCHDAWREAYRARYRTRPVPR